MEEQENWQAHAAFMNALHSEGFVLLGGPLEGTPNTLLIIEASDTEEIKTRLSNDPWLGLGCHASMILDAGRAQSG
jgi:uncharacterized protein YciI